MIGRGGRIVMFMIEKSRLPWKVVVEIMDFKGSSGEGSERKEEGLCWWSSG